MMRLNNDMSEDYDVEIEKRDLEELCDRLRSFGGNLRAEDARRYAGIEEKVMSGIAELINNGEDAFYDPERDEIGMTVKGNYWSFPADEMEELIEPEIFKSLKESEADPQQRERARETGREEDLRRRQTEKEPYIRRG